MDHQGERSGGYDTVGRRGFFRLLAGETVAFFEELRGRPQFRLSDLWGLPDEALARIIPKVPPDVEIVVAEGHISARIPGKDEPINLFDRELANTFVLNRFNGLTPIGRIGAELAAAMSWDEERGFANAKSLFLRMVRLGVCMPSNSIR